MIAAFFQQSPNMNGDIYAVRLDTDGNAPWLGAVEVTNSGNSKSDMMVGKGIGCLFIAWSKNGNVYAHSLREDGILGAADVSLTGDINGDGNINVLDVVMLVGHILNSDASELESGDINSDGDIDVLLASLNDNKIAWFKNDGATDPSFTAYTITSDANLAGGVFAIEVDGDGDMDVISSSQGDDKIAWYENK